MRSHRNLVSIFVGALSAAAGLPACTMSSGGPADPPASATVSLAALEAAEADAGDPADAGSPKVGDYPGWTACEALCPGQRQDCSVASINGNQATLTCYYDATGRRPAGYRAPPARAGGGIGRHFARIAALEAISVVAFRGLSRELSMHRAPRTLIKGCRRAARDELRHARATSAIARARGGAVSLGTADPSTYRSLEAIAVENAVEGCVRETFGALVAHWQAREASDPVVRDAMRRIARDETRHAALSWSIDAWARSRLDRATRARVDAARATAARALIADVGRRSSEPWDAALGLPSAVQERTLARALEKRLYRSSPKSSVDHLNG